MPVVPKPRASKWLRRARDPGSRDLSRPAAPLAPPAASHEGDGPERPDLFAIADLAGIDDNAFVHLLYRGLLLREPEEGGRSAALQDLAAQPSREQRAQMVRAFLASNEFRRGSHDRESEGRRLAGLLVPEFQDEVGEILADILPDPGKMRQVWDAIVSRLFEDGASFLEVCKLLGRPEINNGWIGRIEGAELSGLLPAHALKEDDHLRITFDGRADDLPLEEAIEDSIDNGSGSDLYLVRIDLADHYNMSGALHAVGVALADGTPIEPSPIYVFTPETREFNGVMDAAESGSYDLFGTKPFRKPSSLF